MQTGTENPTHRAPQGSATLVSLLQEQALRQPHAPAVLAPARDPLSYAGLLAQVQRLAGHLTALGASPSTRLAVVLPNGPEMAVAFVGVAACASCAPLNPAYTAAEFRFHLQDTRAEMVLMLRSEAGPARAVARELGLKIVEIEADPAAPAGQFRLVDLTRADATAQAGAAIRWGTPDDVALLLHTSGTTARPKLVPLSQANLLASARNIAAHLALSPADCCLNVMPLFHIHGLVGALLASLAGGGRVVCAPGFDDRHFFDWIAHFNPSWYSAVPTLHQAVLAHGERYREKAPAHQFRFVRSSSAALPAATLRRLQDLLQAPVVEAYGMTEASHQMASNPVQAGAQTAGSVGVAAGVQVAILGPTGRPVPQGEPGEIAICGPGVTRGYENNPQANAEAFQDGWFRTGDLGQLDKLGRLFISGRLKEIVNRGGEKVSPREVDDALLEHPDVVQAAAFGVPHPSLGEDLAAAVVRRTGAALTEPALREFLLARLAGFKVPSQIVFVQSIPAGATGKVQRSTLHQTLGASLTRAFVAPASPHESAVELIFREVLECGPLGVHDNFFARGGDSLRGARVIARVNRQFGLKLAVTHLFQHPSVAELVQAMRWPTAAAGADDTADAGISRRPGGGPAAGSFSQDALWIVERLTSSTGVYNSAQAVRITGALDVPALNQALQSLLQRHEVLRTAFEERDGVPMQVVHAHAAAPLVEINAADLPATSAHALLQDRLGEAVQQAFDLTCAPLLRASLWRLDKDRQDHVLLLVVHHLVADGWSMQVIARELSALYSAFRASPASASQAQPTLPPLPIQFADWAHWQREQQRGPRHTADLGYWRGQLTGLAPLAFPTDRPRPPRLSDAGRCERFTIAPALLATLRALALEHNVTLFMLLLAAFKVLLMRHSQQDDVAVGSPVAGRDRPELEGLVGYFVNSVVLRSDLSGNPRFTELLGRVRQTALDAYTHQGLPFDHLVAELSPQRDLSRNPLYQVSFALNNQPAPAYTLAGLSAQPMALETRIAKFDLSLTVAEVGGELHGEFEYSTDLFEASTVQRLSAQVQTLLAGIAADAGQRIATLPVLSDAERRLVLTDWNRTEQPWPLHLGVHTMVEQQAARAPQACAVVFGAERLSYAELNARANRLAHHLRTLDVGPEVMVGVCMERSLHLAVALLAVLKAGGAFVPLDPELPTARLVHMLHDTQAPVVLTQAHLSARLAEPGPAVEVPPRHLLCLDAPGPALASALAASDPHDPASLTGPDSLAYVIYTSGSTGRPKGVMSLHRGLSNHICWLAQVMAVTPIDRVLQKTTIGFDAAVWEFFTPWQAGATLVLARPGEQRDPEALVRTMRDEGITIVQFVPSALRALLDEPALAACTPLRHMMSGGEALDWDLARAFQARLPGATLGNFYGPSEASDDVTHTVAGPRANPNPGLGTTPHSNDLSSGTGSVPIGRPIANVQCYVLDAHLQPLPIGAAGELFVGGAGLARGYLGRPELTAERFVAHPFAPGQRLYRTGDRVRWRADGQLDCLGRSDSQVKIRGQRVELGEIEAALNAQPGVHQAVVVVRDIAPGLASLVAYVVGVPAAGVDPTHMKARLATLLPSSMLPDAFVVLDALPTLPNGKINRNALPMPHMALGPMAPVPPRTPTEQAAWEIWRELLRTDTFGVHDNFFDLGGQSLLAAQVMSRLRAALQIALPLQALFDAPTVAGLALRADAAAHDSSSPQAPITPRGHDRPVPLSAVQRSMWMTERVQGRRAAYHMPTAERLSGPLHTAALERALAALVQRHDSLRLFVVVQDGTPLQRLNDSATLALEVIDLSTLPATAQTQRLQTLLPAHADAPFDLARAPLARALLVKLANEEHVLQLVLHHLASDGWSAQLLRDDLAALYQAHAEGTEPPPPNAGPGYLDYAAWEAGRIASGALAPHTRYWTQRLHGLAPLNLPFGAGTAGGDRRADGADRTEGDRRSNPADVTDPRIRMALPPGVVAGLAALARRGNATLFMVYLAAFKLLLMRWCDQTDVAVGTPIARRDRPELAHMVGPLLNTMVLRTDLAGEPSFEALLARVRDTALQAYLHQEQPFDSLVAALNPVRVDGRNPLFDVLVNALPAAQGDAPLAGLLSRPIELDTGAAKFALTLYIQSQIGAADFVLHYRGALFAPGPMAALMDQYGHLLAQIAAQPQAAITSYSLVTEPARALLADPHQPLRRSLPDTGGQTLFAAFCARAAERPDTLAATSAEGELSYGQLERLSRGLGEWLVAQGIRPGDRVALHADRCLGLVVAVLGVARAGAVFSILDSAYPDERNRDCIAQLSPKLILVCGDHAWEGAGHGAPSLRIPARPHDLLQHLARAPQAQRLPPAPPERPRRAALPAVDPRAAAYVSFTSGTTGRPKGIVTAHAPLPHFVAWHAVQHSLVREDRFSMLSGLAHDPLLRDLFTPLSIGATLCIPPPPMLQQPDRLVGWLAAERVSVAHLTPALGDVIATGCGTGRRLEPLRRLFWGGDRLTGRTVERLRTVAPHAMQVNFYGTTETPQAMAHYAVPVGRAAHAQPVGRGIEGAQLLLLAPNGRQAGVGESAEIFVRSPYLALGYLHDDALTQARFVPNPFSTDPEDRLYRTGDLGRSDSQGNVLLLGRIDDQVNVRGLRVEPAEIERVAQQVPGVERAIVKPVQPAPALPGDSDASPTALLLYYACRAGAQVPAAAVEAQIRHALPGPMWPRAVIQVAAFARLPNGKVDLRALPDAAPAQTPAVQAHDAPRGPAERAIAQVWQELLGVSRLSRADNFFDLGGHSLLALRAGYLIEQACGLRLDLRRLVHESLAQLAEPAPGASGKGGRLRRAGLVSRILEGIGFGAGR